MKIVATCAALAGLAGSARAASAQTSEQVSEERQMTLPMGRALVETFAEISLSQDDVGQPISLAPDIWYGVSEILTIGLVNSGRGATGLLGDTGNGLCLTGSDNECPKVYNSVGVDGRYHFYRKGEITAAADGGLYARSIDPFALALKFGAVGRWQEDKLAVEIDPSLFVGLTQRNVGYKENFFLPMTALYELSPKLGLAGQLGIGLPFENTGDTYQVGISIGAQYTVSDQLFADAAFSLPALLGGDLITNGFDARTFTLGVGYAL